MQRKFLWLTCFAIGLCACLWAGDWPSTGGNPQRDGWAQGEKDLSKENIAAKNVELLYKYKFDGNEAKGLESMSMPIVLNSIIGYKGFKQLVFVGGSSDIVYAFDADTSEEYFKTPLQTAARPAASSSTAVCSSGMTAGLAMQGNSAPGRGFTPPPAARGAAGARGAMPGAAPAPAPARGAGRGPMGPAVFWAVSSDGYLHTIREQDGDAKYIPTTKFVPANSNVSGLNVNNNVIYASTVNNCGGNANGLYAALYTPPQLPPTPNQPLVNPASFSVVSFMTNGSGFSGTGGTVIGTDGMVYGQVADGHGDVAGVYNDTVLAMDPKTLEVKDYFTPSGNPSPTKKDVESPGVTPVYFSWNGQGVLVAGGRGGRLYILDASSLGGSDHHTPLYASDPVVAPDSKFGGNGVWGNLATWTDEANGGTRWLYASIRGPAAMRFPVSNGTASTGAIVAFKVVDQAGKPSLSPQWISRDMISPAAPATANGLVFALSTGETPRVAKADGTPYTAAEEEKMAKNAVLYILDGATGQELLSSGNTATTFAHSGIAVANGRVYFTTHDNTLYAYGVPEER
jgi:outer membrane protein assembly factor BamB